MFNKLEQCGLYRFPLTPTLSVSTDDATHSSKRVCLKLLTIQKTNKCTIGLLRL